MYVEIVFSMVEALSKGTPSERAGIVGSALLGALVGLYVARELLK